MKTEFTKQWIIENAIKICSGYEHGVLTIRALHYQLVGIGMTNDMSHYKKVVNAMIDARWAGDIAFEQFSDLDRKMEGETKYELTTVEESVDEAKTQIRAWMNFYGKNRWENQSYYPEILIEKKALQGVFEPVCKKFSVAMGACKGYPSLTFLNELATRLKDTIDNGKNPIILYFGDYDPSGEDIPRSILKNLKRFDVDNIELRRIALMEHQVKEWNLPPAPTKQTDSRSGNWDGIGQVELDAVRPEQLIRMCTEAIEEIFDEELYDDLRAMEIDEKIEYRQQLKEYVKTL